MITIELRDISKLPSYSRISSMARSWDQWHGSTKNSILWTTKSV
jgi:hypothetical protein